MVATITENDIDLGKDIIVKSQEKEDVPCEFYEDICGNSAQFVYLRTCCGVELFMCADCTITIMRQINDDAKNKSHIHCMLCETHIDDPSKWLRYVGKVS